MGCDDSDLEGRKERREATCCKVHREVVMVREYEGLTVTMQLVALIRKRESSGCTRVTHAHRGEGGGGSG